MAIMPTRFSAIFSSAGETFTSVGRSSSSVLRISSGQWRVFMTIAPSSERTDTRRSRSRRANFAIAIWPVFSSVFFMSA